MGRSASILQPTHRRLGEEQLEVCELCGIMVGRERLKVADVDGLRGYKVCDRHEPLSTNPGPRDYTVFAPLEIPEVVERLEPVGGPVWWEGVWVNTAIVEEVKD